MMKNSKNKILIKGAVLVAIIFLVIDQCSTINLTTSDLFRPTSYQKFKELPEKPQSENYEIVPVDGSFPILYDSIRNEFYVRNHQGLSKYDALGNLMFTKDLNDEKYTSVFHFMNYVPYVFTLDGVYDFSTHKLTYFPFIKIENVDDKIREFDFKTVFENYYNEADLVVYDYEVETDTNQYARPMYFNIENKWSLLFAPRDEYRFSHDGHSDIENDTIGQIDFLNFPAKLSKKKMIVLKDERSGRYSTSERGDRIDDAYLESAFNQILPEKNLNYRTQNKIKILSQKKDEYNETGNPFSLPNWILPSFINTGYFQASYNKERLNFREKIIKNFGEFTMSNDFYLYELPKHLRKKSKVAFLHYALDVGGFTNDSTGLNDPIIKNAGLYIIKPKKNKGLQNQ